MWICWRRGRLAVKGTNNAMRSSLRLTVEIAVPDGDAAFDILGYTIIGTLILAWIISVAVYKFNRYDEIDVVHAD
jgi:high-affinity nickel permease